MKHHNTPSKTTDTAETNDQHVTRQDFGSNQARTQQLTSVSDTESVNHTEEEYTASQWWNHPPQTRSGNLKKQSSMQRGSVKLRLQGAAISPPEFRRGLPEIHDWLMQNQTALKDWAGDIEVIFSGEVQQREQVIWSYYHPHQQLVLKGVGKAMVTGFPISASGKKRTRRATPGYFLAYRPIIAQPMGDKNAPTPAAANLQMTGLTIEGFVSGGVEISPRSGQLPSAEEYADPTYDQEWGHDHGGLNAFLSGAILKKNTFQKMGTKYQKKGLERYNTKKSVDPTAYQYAGYGGVIARGLHHSQLINNKFDKLINRGSKKTNETPGATNPTVLWKRLIHGIYLRDQSSFNTIHKNDFDDISGAPVKFTNAANNNKVRKNKAHNVGVDAFVLEHFSRARREFDSLGYAKDQMDIAEDGKPYIDKNILGKRFNSNTKLKPFKEKAVGQAPD